MEEKGNPGRPTVITELVMRKLEEAFSEDLSIADACEYAEIGERTYYDHYADDEEFRRRIDGFKRFLEKRAKKNLAFSLNESEVKTVEMATEDGGVDYKKQNVPTQKAVETSKWYLERKVKDEYSRRDEVTGKDGEPIGTSIEDLVKAVQGVVEDEHNARNNPED